MPIRKPATNKLDKRKPHDRSSSSSLFAFELGRIKNLSIAELENVLGQENLVELIGDFAIFNLDPIILKNFVPTQNNSVQNDQLQSIQKLQNKLGGTIKIAKVVETISLNNPQSNNSPRDTSEQQYSNKTNHQNTPQHQPQSKTFVASTKSALEQLLTSHFKDHSGKIPFAISVVNIPGDSKIFLKNSLNFSKKILKSMGFNSRFINKPWVNAEPAQIYKSWTVEKGIDITILGGNIHTGEPKIYIAKTLSIQDINSYSFRDYNKPFRDTHMGMLPPKLAQIMLNLAENSHPTNTKPNSQTTTKQIIFDPFCGSGTILAEALLQGKEAIGSDIDQKAVDGTIKNLNWLVENFFDKAKKQNPPPFKVFQKNSVLLTKNDFPKNLDIVVSETYLGLPASKIIPQNERRIRFEEIASLHKNWLSNLKKALTPKDLQNLKIVIALPAFKIGPNNYNYFPNPREFFRSLGFEVQNKKTLIYDREDQFVAREILIIVNRN